MRVTKRDYMQAAINLDLVLHWNETIEPGDMYLAGRNTDIKLLTCRSVGNGCIYPMEADYPYDINECIKVVGW